ncbi:MAG: hypothetical protein MHPSP_003452 [Paramarteilia canceri]
MLNELYKKYPELPLPLSPLDSPTVVFLDTAKNTSVPNQNQKSNGNVSECDTSSDTNWPVALIETSLSNLKKCQPLHSMMMRSFIEGKLDLCKSSLYLSVVNIEALDEVKLHYFRAEICSSLMMYFADCARKMFDALWST